VVGGLPADIGVGWDKPVAQVLIHCNFHYNFLTRLHGTTPLSVTKQPLAPVLVNQSRKYGLMQVAFSNINPCNLLAVLAGSKNPMEASKLPPPQSATHQSSMDGLNTTAIQVRPTSRM
jgi:hypothetical protein